MMPTNRPTLTILLLLVGVPLCILCGQTSPPQTPSLRMFFESLVVHRGELPKYDDVLKVTDQVSGDRPENISNALPSIMVALSNQDDVIKTDAALALFAIGLRPDSAALLRTHINDLGAVRPATAIPALLAGKKIRAWGPGKRDNRD
jgi:hypothetical protein